MDYSKEWEEIRKEASTNVTIGKPYQAKRDAAILWADSRIKQLEEALEWGLKTGNFDHLRGLSRTGEGAT